MRTSRSRKLRKTRGENATNNLATATMGNGRYEREDWTLFRSIRTISQLSGVQPDKLRALVAKELADNALDAGGTCRVGELDDGWFFVEDNGAGIQGKPKDIARLFSFRRPLVSSKVKRLPTRGALGNGLRVVAGAVFASGGSMRVLTQGRALVLSPQESGETLVEWQTCEWTTGTRVEVRLGDTIPADPDFLEWAEKAILAAGVKAIYSGKTSPYWYDSDAFFELLQAAGARTVREVLIEFDGCSRQASDISKPFAGRPASSLTFDEAEELLMLARSHCEPVRVGRLAMLKSGLPGSYASKSGMLKQKSGRGTIAAELPFTVEAWCNSSPDGTDYLTVFVNRTPVTCDTRIRRDQQKTDVAIFGCNLHRRFKVGRNPVDIVVNVQIPFMPITSNGKEPDLELFLASIQKPIERAARKCQRANRSSKHQFQNQMIIDSLATAIGHVSGEGKYRFSLRQLFYAIRPRLYEAFGKEPNYGTFTRIIADYERERGEDIVGMYRDDRGVLYHPHLRTQIALGTLSVEKYQRPKWTFNKIVYSEKEGFFAILQSAGWPERHDCALLTSKGQATKAAKDVIDFLGETGEELLFFCIHDADAAGTVIYEALQEATRARPARRVKIINLGLEPWEAAEMGLHVENVKPGKKGRKPVGSYVPKEWADWLQTNRTELNEMTTPQLINWLDAKMEQYGNGKIIPPIVDLANYLAESVHKRVEESTRERILREAGFPKQIQATMQRLEPIINERTSELKEFVKVALSERPVELWRAPIERMADEIARK